MIKKGTRVKLIYCNKLTGMLGTVKNVFSDTDCIYAQYKMAMVKLDSGITKVIATSLLREV